jgi:dinuclear metal center YbgI/SA1388 family protein
MIRISDLTQYLESVAPLHLQESYDNSGLILGNADQTVTQALICLDVTVGVVREAVEKGCNLIIAHHPLIFRGLMKINGSNEVERAVILAIRHDIGVYAIHTNLDNVLQDGVNGRIAEHLGLQSTEVLAPRTEGAAGTGSGVIGHLAEALGAWDFLHFLRERMELAVIRHTALPEVPVKSVAVCGGSGSFLLEQAKRAGAQAFVSADFKYHDFFGADGQILIADIGHYESERFTMDLIRDLIMRKFPNFAAQLTRTVTNPISYYP